MNAITLTRQQLYDLVWSESLLSLSKKYIISDVGLRKMCFRLAIPLPNAGHWNKVKAGKEVAIKQLAIRNDVEQSVSLTVRSADQAVNRDQPSAQNILQQEIENDPLLNLVVPEVLIDPDPLISSAKKALLKKDRFYTEGGLLLSGGEDLNIKISYAQMNRGLCFLDTFIKAMKQRGYSFKIKNYASYLILGDEEMKMSLREIQKSLTSEKTAVGVDYQPSGILVFRFEQLSTSTEIRDGKTSVEQQISKLIARLELIKERFRLEAIESEKRRLIYEEQQRLREESAKRRKLELDTFMQVLNDVERWRETKLLREYIVQIEANAAASGELTEDLITWLNWIKGKADWLDPLLEMSDGWLDEIDPNSLLKNLRQSNTDGSLKYGHSGYNEPPKQKSIWPVLPWNRKKSNYSK